jgi:hypothetical protein
LDRLAPTRFRPRPSHAKPDRGPDPEVELI